MKGISEYKKRVRYTHGFNTLNKLLKTGKVNTICHSAACPNIGECFEKRKLTFLILGDVCTRNCGFCNVKTGKPSRVDADEPKQIAGLVEKLNLKYVVITSVTRDDLDDGGCSVFLDTVKHLKKVDPEIKVEILIPDLKGSKRLLKKITLCGADVVGHNIETVERVYSKVRPEADFKRSLEVLKYLKQTVGQKKKIKSGFMVGLGEDIDEIKKLLKTLYEHGVRIVTAGQYFQPSSKNVPVERVYTDKEFKEIETYAGKIGFKYTSFGRFVRSSYYAEEVFKG